MDEKEKERIKHHFHLAYVLSIVVLGIGVVFYMVFEKLSIVDAFYFSVVTLATVGYGDITPKTDIGKIFTAFYIIGGIGVIAAFANLLIKNAAINREMRLNQRRKNKKSE